jgi:hypothetical protein
MTATPAGRADPPEKGGNSGPESQRSESTIRWTQGRFARAFARSGLAREPARAARALLGEHELNALQTFENPAIFGRRARPKRVLFVQHMAKNPPPFLLEGAFFVAWRGSFCRLTTATEGGIPGSPHLDQIDTKDDAQ